MVIQQRGQITEEWMRKIAGSATMGSINWRGGLVYSGGRRGSTEIGVSKKRGGGRGGAKSLAQTVKITMSNGSRIPEIPG